MLCSIDSPDLSEALDKFWFRNHSKMVEKIRCKIGLFRKYMFYDTILKYNNLNKLVLIQLTIFSRINYIVRFEMFGRIFLSKWFWNQAIVSGSKPQKTKKKWCFRNRSRPMKWARETLISQWYLFICFLPACYVPSSRITTVHWNENAFNNDTKRNFESLWQHNCLMESNTYT